MTCKLHNTHLGGLFMHQKRGGHWKKSTNAMQRREAENEIRVWLSRESVCIFIEANKYLSIYFFSSPRQPDNLGNNLR
jgi:hypothetical protein